MLGRVSICRNLQKTLLGRVGQASLGLQQRKALDDQVPTLEPVVQLRSLGEPKSQHWAFDLEKSKLYLVGSCAALTITNAWVQVAGYSGRP